jgi:hypothetical protein
MMNDRTAIATFLALVAAAAVFHFGGDGGDTRTRV